MPNQYEKCLRTLMHEVSGQDVDELTDDQVERLRAAGGREEEGQNVFNCEVGGCSMETRTQVIAGKILLMSTDVRVDENPCND